MSGIVLVPAFCLVAGMHVVERDGATLRITAVEHTAKRVRVSFAPTMVGAMNPATVREDASVRCLAEPCPCGGSCCECSDEGMRAVVEVAS